MFLALQEVWTTEARDAILGKTKRTYPFHYWPQEYNENVGCDLSDPYVQGISYYYITCLQDNGVDTRTVQQPITPVPRMCLEYAIGLAIHNFETHYYENQLCLACLINGMELLPQEQAFGVFQMCGGGVGPKYGHNGVNGQLILSKHPIKKVEEHRLPAFIVNRVNIHATIAGVRFGFGHFAFNLLEDALPDLAPLMYGALQTTHVQDFLDAKVDVIVGDMNSGPNYQSAGYNLLLSSGYKLVSPDVPTWCDEARAGFTPCVNAQSIPMPIDHIFVRAASPIISFHPSTFNRKPIMSDHIGVSATVLCWWCFV